MNLAPAFEPDFASPSDWASMYRGIGWQVVPAHMPTQGDWKFPKLAKWKTFQDELVPDVQFERWYGNNGEYFYHRNAGLLTGRASGNTFVIDLDNYKDVGAVEWWHGILEVHNNGMEIETCEQVTGGGGRQLFYHAPPDWNAPTNRMTIGVDIRGQGGFAMLPPSMHSSGRSYEWKSGYAPWECEIAMAPDWLLTEVTDLVKKYGGDKNRQESGPITSTPSPDSDFNSFGSRIDGREDYMTRLVWGVVTDWHRECPIPPSDAESQAKAKETYATYERLNKSRLVGVNGEGNSALLEREGRGVSLFMDKWRRAMGKWSTEVASAAAHPPTDNEWREAKPDTVEVTKAVTPIGVPLQSAFPIIESSIPPRDWIIPGLFLKRHLSVLVAPPGSGKSLLTLQLAIAMGVGMAWGGWKVRGRKRVLVVNAEDDGDEMKRRLFAAAKEMKVDQADLVGWVLLAEAPESIVIARTDSKTKTVVRTPLLEELVYTMTTNDIECVIVDPFAETFEGDENSNSEIKWAGILWREVARRTSGSVMLVHHTKKYAGAMAGDADASRGGGALIGTARILSTLFAMTEEEAATINVMPEDRTKYVRFDDAKANLSLITGQAKWFEKQSITLNNGTQFVPGDDVGVLVPWVPPGMLDNVTMFTIGQVLDTIDRGLMDEHGLPTGQFYTATASGPTKDRWAGVVIIRLLGCDEKRAKHLLKDWLKNEVLQTYDYTDPIARKSRSGVRSILNNRPDRQAK